MYDTVPEMTDVPDQELVKELLPDLAMSSERPLKKSVVWVSQAQGLWGPEQVDGCLISTRSCFGGWFCLDGGIVWLYFALWPCFMLEEPTRRKIDVRFA